MQLAWSRTTGFFFSVGVIAPGPTQGKGAGNNISNFVPFYVCAGSCPAVTGNAQSLTSRAASGAGDSASISSRYEPFTQAADSAGEFERIFLRDTCRGADATCIEQVVPISVALGGGDANGPSDAPSVSRDGRFVTFASSATNLVSGDTNAAMDIFVRDTCIGAAASCSPSTFRVSLGVGGAEANGPSSAPAISGDGRFVVFDSTATNLTADGLAGPPQFLRDTCFAAQGACTPATTRVQPAP